jgi:outer membrane protein
MSLSLGLGGTGFSLCEKSVQEPLFIAPAKSGATQIAVQKTPVKKIKWHRAKAYATHMTAVLLITAVCHAQDTLHLTLAEAEKLALQNNPHITAAQLDAAAAAQVPAQYSAAFQPNVFGSFTGVGADSASRLAAGGLNNPIVYNRLGSGLSISQLVTDFGRTSNLVAAAKFHASAQDQQTQLSKDQVLLATDRAYFAVLRAESVLKVANETVAARQLVSDQVTLLAKSHLKSALDVSFANVNLGEARLLLASAQNDLKSSTADLASAMGIPGQTNFVLADEPMPDALPDKADPLIQEAIAKRPDLAGLRLEHTAAERTYQSERALMFPTIGVIGTAGFVPSGEATVPGRYGAIGLNVTVPLFNGGLFKARRNEADLRTRAAEQRVNDLRNQVVRDVRVAYLNAETAFDRVGLTAQVLQQAQLALELAQRRYDLGLSSIVELSQAQLNLTSAQIANVGAKYEYQGQRAVLQYQVGGR